MLPPAPRVLAPLLDRALFSSLQVYVRGLLREEVLRYEDWGRRHIRHNDPFGVLLHHQLTPRVSAEVGRALKPSYCFLACYGDEGQVPPHTDREQCQYTLDLCVESRGEWPLFVDGRPWTFGENEALLYAGTEQEHHRDRKPAGAIANLLFFH